MQKRNLILIATVACLVAISAAGTAFAANIQKAETVTCPNCGSEFELERPDGGDWGKKGAMSLDDLKTRLSELVESGKITQEEADSKIAEFEERQAEREARKAELQSELDQKVADGELTQEEADRIVNNGRMGGKEWRLPEDDDTEAGYGMGRGERGHIPPNEDSGGETPDAA